MGQDRNRPIDAWSKFEAEITKRFKEAWKEEQNKSLIVSVALMILACLFPPWRLYGNGGSVSMGFAFLLRPPDQVSQVDIGLLLIELLLIGLVGGLVWIVLKKGDSKPTQRVKGGLT